MRKLFFILFIICAIQGHTQTLKQIEAAKKQEEADKSTKKVIPPIMVRAAFAKDFPGTQVSWEKERGHYEANYMKEGKKFSVLYGDSGHKIESETVLEKSQMPADVMKYIDLHYKGQPISETSIIKKSNGEENYEVEIKGMNILFTKQGKYIKTLKE